MPIYEYRCEDCGTKFEKLVRRSADAAELGCPSCGQKRLRQEFSTFAARSGRVNQSSEAQMCPSGRCMHPEICSPGRANSN